MTLILRLLHDKRPSTRLLAATCLTNLNKCGVIPPAHQSDVTLLVLPTLVKLFAEAGPIKTRAPLVLAYLVSESEDLQKAACDADAVSKLAHMLMHPDVGPYHDQLQEVRAE